MKLSQPEKTILAMLRRQGSLTRVQIAKITNFSSSTVSDISSQLLSKGLVTDGDGQQVSRGRRPVPLVMNRCFGQMIGIELTDGYVRGLLVDFAGNIVAHADLMFHPPLDISKLIDDVAGIIQSLLSQVSNTYLGCGIALYGTIDSSRGVSVSFPPYDWEDVPIVQLLQERVTTPVYLETRMYAAALAELNYGCGRHHDSFAYINADQGTTFGLACVDNGRIIRGTHQLAGQLAHLCVQPGGERCYCGGCGCLATVAAPSTIVAQAVEQANSGVYTILNKKLRPSSTNEPQISFIDLLEAYRQQDKLAVSLIVRAAQYLGLGISHVINLFDPGYILLGGVLAQTGPDFTNIICQTIEQHSVKGAYTKDIVVNSQLGFDGPALGAAEIVAERFLELLNAC